MTLTFHMVRYSLPSFLSIPEKAQLSTAVLTPQSPPVKTLNITYLSARHLPSAPPRIVARGIGWPRWRLGIEGVNARVCRWLLQQLVGGEDTSLGGNERMKNDDSVRVNPTVIRGWALMDFFAGPKNSPVVPLFVEFNFIGRGKGHSGFVKW